MEYLQHIVSEYAQIRESGLDVKAAMQSLRPYVEPLEKQERDELITLLRQWEAMSVPAAQPAGAEHQMGGRPSSVIRPLAPPAPAEKIITCSNCGRQNKAADVFCPACGHLLEGIAGAFDTKHFNDETELLSDEYYAPDSTLVLRVRDFDYQYSVRPQGQPHEMIIGRSAGHSAMMPDVDMSECGGADMGVSRLHMSIRYNPDDNTIQIYDLGSANGSFINGQKLHPREVRVLRHRDELRLGRMVVQVQFLHNG